MNKALFSPVAGLIQDILLLSALSLFALGLVMLVWLQGWDYFTARNRRKAMAGRVGLPVIQ